MFDSLGVKTIICPARRGPYKLPLFKNMLRASEFRIDKYRLCHSFTAEGKNKFLRKLYLIWKRDTLLDNILCCEKVVNS